VSDVRHTHNVSTPATDVPYDGVVLAGCGSQRLGLDKTAVVIDGETSLDRVLRALEGARRRVVVGEARPVRSPVVWTREDPPGSGPAAGVVAALDLVTAPRVVLLAADSPFVSTGTVTRLLAALPGQQAVTLVDGDGRRQHLITVADTVALRAAAASRPSWVDGAMHALLAPLDAATLPAEERETLDLDTPEQLAATRRLR